MRIGLMHITPYSKADPAIVAKHAEARGFESYWVGDHTILPVDSSREYSGERPEGKEPSYVSELPDPFIALARAGATTSRIKLGTAICLVPTRNPLLAAKQIATLDDATGGRFVFGIGAGWNPEECRIMGGDFEHRWSQVKEYVAAMKVLWTEPVSEFHGKYVDFPPVKCFPKPARKPHPPVLIGAPMSNPRAFRRVIEWGDGWLPAKISIEEFAEGVATLREGAEKAGRDPDTLEFVAFSNQNQWQTPEEIRQLTAAGATRVVLWLKEEKLDFVLQEIDRIADALSGVMTAP